MVAPPRLARHRLHRRATRRLVHVLRRTQRPVRIFTNFQHMHWVAWDDDDYYQVGDPLGTGRSEAEAIEDLREQLMERGYLVFERRES